MSGLIEIRDWLNFVAEWIIVWILIAEYRYDAQKDLLKAQKKTKTTKKTTTGPNNQNIVEETVETVEPVKEDKNVGRN